MLTIAGFDPSSGAGVTADLAMFQARGFFGTACITALTVQSTLGVRRVELVGATTVSDTLQCLEEDVPAHGIKVGMLAGSSTVHAVAQFLRAGRAAGRERPVVLDPVLRSSSGRELLSAEGVTALKDVLLPQVDWVTPNLAELGALVGGSIGTRAEMETGAMVLQSIYPRLGVVVTGGHLADSGVADLVLAPGAGPVWLEGERIVSRSTHGTGCAFSSAFACGLVEGFSAVEAASEAKRFVAEAIRTAVPLGKGTGPMNLHAGTSS